MGAPVGLPDLLGVIHQQIEAQALAGLEGALLDSLGRHEELQGVSAGVARLDGAGTGALALSALAFVPGAQPGLAPAASVRNSPDLVALRIQEVLQAFHGPQ